MDPVLIARGICLAAGNQQILHGRLVKIAGLGALGFSLRVDINPIDHPSASIESWNLSRVFGRWVYRPAIIRRGCDRKLIFVRRTRYTKAQRFEECDGPLC
jgi:hypothetical protein